MKNFGFEQFKYLTIKLYTY